MLVGDLNASQGLDNGGELHVNVALADTEYFIGDTVGHFGLVCAHLKAVHHGLTAQARTYNTESLGSRSSSASDGQCFSFSKAPREPDQFGVKLRQPPDRSTVPPGGEFSQILKDVKIAAVLGSVLKVFAELVDDQKKTVRCPLLAWSAIAAARSASCDKPIAERRSSTIDARRRIQRRLSSPYDSAERRRAEGRQFHARAARLQLPAPTLPAPVLPRERVPQTTCRRRKAQSN